MSNEKKYTRFPFLPLSYALKHMAVPGELMIDYEYGGVYVRNLEDTEDIIIASSDSIKHVKRTDNPHKVTKEDIGLGNLINERQATSEDFDKHLITPNPHKINKEKVGLGKVENYSVATVQDVLNGRPDRYVTPSILSKVVEEYGINVGQNFNLIIEPTPADATVQVLIDGTWVNGRMHILPLNTYKYKVNKEGYLEASGVILLNTNMSTPIKLELLGYNVNFNIDPPDALVEVRVRRKKVHTNA